MGREKQAGNPAELLAKQKAEEEAARAAKAAEGPKVSCALRKQPNRVHAHMFA